jgi:hypothetical protein
VREIEVNVAYRWFLRLKLTDKVFDASTLSQNRRRRYQDETIAQAIFDRIVEQTRANMISPSSPSRAPTIGTILIVRLMKIAPRTARSR